MSNLPSFCCCQQPGGTCIPSIIARKEHFGWFVLWFDPNANQQLYPTFKRYLTLTITDTSGDINYSATGSIDPHTGVITFSEMGTADPASPLPNILIGAGIAGASSNSIYVSGGNQTLPDGGSVVLSETGITVNDPAFGYNGSMSLSNEYTPNQIQGDINSLLVSQRDFSGCVAPSFQLDVFYNSVQWIGGIGGPGYFDPISWFQGLTRDASGHAIVQSSISGNPGIIATDLSSGTGCNFFAGNAIDAEGSIFVSSKIQLNYSGTYCVAAQTKAVTSDLDIINGGNLVSNASTPQTLMAGTIIPPGPMLPMGDITYSWTQTFYCPGSTPNAAGGAFQDPSILCGHIP